MPTGKRVTRRSEKQNGHKEKKSVASTSRYQVLYMAPVKCKDGKVRRLMPSMADQLTSLLTAAQLADLERGGLITRLE